MLLVGIAALAAAAAVAVVAVLWLTRPGGDLRAAIPGLHAPVAVDFDGDGIPRIRAGDRLDAAAALGFLHARERLFEMDLMRRAASGELAEQVGSQALPVDRFMRTMGVRRRAEADLATLPAATRELLDAYARGVNAWIARRGRWAAPEFALLGRPRPWQAVDSLLWGKTMGLYLSSNWQVELARLALGKTMDPARIESLWPGQDEPGRPEAAWRADPLLAATATRIAAAVPTFPAPFTLPDQASNAWAVDGRHSVSGAPLLAGDPHLAFGLPSIWYLARVETPGHVLVGATAPGVPMLVIGHNGHVAWSFTTTGADTQDLFVETSAGDGRYATPDGPQPYVTRTETIHVRGAADVVLSVRETRHGPVVSDIVDTNGPLLALAMANLMPGDTAASGLVALNEATDVAAAGRAAARISQPVQNLMVADHDGIALFVTGRVPIRRGGDGSLPAPGADGSHDWTGFASGDALPHYLAPPSGRLVNANDRVAPPDFPVFMGRDNFADWRARRIREMLDSHERHDVADFTAMQVDVQSLFAREALPRLLAVPPPDAVSRKALALLAGWDARMTRDAPQPLILNAWMRRFADAVLARLGVAQAARAAAAPWPELAARALSPAGAAWCDGDCAPTLGEALRAAMAELAGRYGGDPAAWRWGAAHVARFEHPLLRLLPWLGRLGGADIASPGDDTTVDRGGFARGFDSIHGASYRGVYDLADLDRSRFVIAPGQSGHVLSRFAGNFAQRWRDGGTVEIGSATGPGAPHIALVPEGDGR